MGSPRGRGIGRTGSCAPRAALNPPPPRDQPGAIMAQEPRWRAGRPRARGGRREARD
jgi:hypothetical protein